MSEPLLPLLVEPDWLDAHRTESDLRILDCTVFLEFDPQTGERRSIAGREHYATAHIPGSGFADILGDLSESNDPAFPYQRPSPAQFSAAMEALGVGDSSRVVLYDRVGNSWAARVWWLLRSFGFEQAGVLNGGWRQWLKENRAVSDAPPAVPDVTFTAEPRPSLVASKTDVLEQMRDSSCLLVNALRPSDFRGAGLVKYGRPGRIPGSVNVPATGQTGIVDPVTHRYRDTAVIREWFEESGALDHDRIITYCGGGIAASNAAFALALLGYEDVAVYDGSLSEWGEDPTLPMVTG